MNLDYVTPVVLATNPDRKKYQDHFFKNVPYFYRNFVIVAEQWGMELGAIREGYSRFDKFCLIQDSMVITNWTWFWQRVNSVQTGYIIQRPSCYAMVYRKDVLDGIAIPEVGQDKEKSIQYEVGFCDEYERQARRLGYDVPNLFTGCTDGEALKSQRFADPYGDGQRLHLRSACGTIHKFKATYR